jgi:hypothetical protein
MVAGTGNVYLFNGDPTFVDGIPQPGVGYIWQFDNTGVLTAPGAVSAVGNIIGGNITTGGIANLNSVRMSQSISWPDYSGSEIYEDGGLVINGPGGVYATGNIAARFEFNDGLGNSSGLYSDIGNSLVYSVGNVIVRSNNLSQTDWTFDTTGNLNLPQGGWIGAAGVKGDGTMLTGGTGQIASLTSFYADAPGIYSSCLTANPDGTLNITTYGNGTGQLGQWTFSGYDTTVPGDILAQEGNDLAVQVFNPTSSGGVTYVVQNRQVDIGNARTTQFEVAPANIVLTTDFSGNKNTWAFGADGSLAFPTVGNVTGAAVAYVADDEISLGTTAGNISIWPGSGHWVFDTTGNLTAPGDISASGNVYASNIMAEAPFEIRVYDFAANIGGRYGVDTQTNTVTATLPANPPVGGAVFFADAAGAYNILNLIINPNGQTIMGTPGNMTVSTPNQSVGLFWNGTTWRIYNAG